MRVAALLATSTVLCCAPPEADFDGVWRLRFEDEMEVRVLVEEQVYTRMMDTSGGLLGLDRPGPALGLNVDCGRRQLICPSEALPEEIVLRSTASGRTSVFWEGAPRHPWRHRRLQALEEGLRLNLGAHLGGCVPRLDSHVLLDLVHGSGGRATGAGRVVMVVGGYCLGRRRPETRELLRSTRIDLTLRFVAEGSP